MPLTRPDPNFEGRVLMVLILFTRRLINSWATIMHQPGTGLVRLCFFVLSSCKLIASMPWPHSQRRVRTYELDGGGAV